MSARDSMNDENKEEYIDDAEGVSDRSYKLLKFEYEKCRQEVYDLKRKLELNEAMLREVQQANESLERSLDHRITDKDKIILEIEEKHRIQAAEYENIILSLETKLAGRTKEIAELQQRAADDRRINLDRTSITDRASDDPSFQPNDAALRNRIDELLSIQREYRKKRESAEETIEALKNRCDEFENYAHSIKEQLDEKNRALEDVRAELALMRAEATSLEMVPIRESHKGNSLFAEVEDRRQNVVNKMNILHEKYTEIKRAYKSQIAKIKVLRAEHVATLRKWENDAGHALSENEELLQTYKSRISDLENKLKSEIGRNDDDVKRSNPTNASFGYFESLLDAKKKETDELRIKVEDLSTKLLVQEETKINIAKELQYWRYKASALEAQISALQAESNLDRTDDEIHKTLDELDELKGARNKDETIDDKQYGVKQRSEDSTRSVSFLPSKVEGDRSPHEKREDYEGRDQSVNKETSNPDTTVKFKLSSTGRSCEFQLGECINGNEHKRVDKLLRFNTDTTIGKSGNSHKPTADSKYPVLYVPIDQKE